MKGVEGIVTARYTNRAKARHQCLTFSGGSCRLLGNASWGAGCGLTGAGSIPRPYLLPWPFSDAGPQPNPETDQRSHGRKQATAQHTGAHAERQRTDWLCGALTHKYLYTRTNTALCFLEPQQHHGALCQSPPVPGLPLSHWQVALGLRPGFPQLPPGASTVYKKPPLRSAPLHRHRRRPPGPVRAARGRGRLLSSAHCACALPPRPERGRSEKPAARAAAAAGARGEAELARWLAGEHERSGRRGLAQGESSLAAHGLGRRLAEGTRERAGRGKAGGGGGAHARPPAEPRLLRDWRPGGVARSGRGGCGCWLADGGGGRGGVGGWGEGGLRLAGVRAPLRRRARIGWAPRGGRGPLERGGWGVWPPVPAEPPEPGAPEARTVRPAPGQPRNHPPPPDRRPRERCVLGRTEAGAGGAVGGPAASSAAARGVGGCGALWGGGCPRLRRCPGRVPGPAGRRAGPGRAPPAREVSAVAPSRSPPPQPRELRVRWWGLPGSGPGAEEMPSGAPCGKPWEGGEDLLPRRVLLNGPRIPWREPSGFTCPALRRRRSLCGGCWLAAGTVLAPKWFWLCLLVSSCSRQMLP